MCIGWPTSIPATDVSVLTTFDIFCWTLSKKVTFPYKTNHCVIYQILLPRGISFQPYITCHTPYYFICWQKTFRGWLTLKLQYCLEIHTLRLRERAIANLGAAILVCWVNKNVCFSYRWRKVHLISYCNFF